MTFIRANRSLTDYGLVKEQKNTSLSPDEQSEFRGLPDNN